MMKYIFCILFGSLLMLGFHYTPDEKVQEAQPNAGVVAMDVQSDTRLAQKISVTVAGQSYGGSHAFDSEASDYTISDGVLGGLFSFRNTTTPSKVLRFCSATIVQMLCLSDTQVRFGQNQTCECLHSSHFEERLHYWKPGGIPEHLHDIRLPLLLWRFRPAGNY